MGESVANLSNIIKIIEGVKRIPCPLGFVTGGDASKGQNTLKQE